MNTSPASRLKIAIIELFTENHYGFADAWARVLGKASDDVTVYALGSFRSFINHSWPCRFVASDTTKRTVDFLNRIRSEGPFDWVIFTTFEGNFLRYSLFLPQSANRILCLHNANRWFKPDRNSDLSPVERFLRKWFVGRANVLCVTSSQIRRTIQERFSVQKPVVVVPFGLNEGLAPVRREAPRFRVVIPGMLSTSRRRIERILVAAGQLGSIDFVFLGAPSRAEGGAEQLEQITQKGLSNVFTFRSFVDNETFQAEMESADLVLSDLNVDFRHPSTNEVYGVTKDSGVSFLMIRYAKPGLFNDEFTNLPELAASTLSFSNTSDLTAALSELASRSDGFRTIQQAAVEASTLFTASAVYERELKSVLAANSINHSVLVQ